MQITITQGLSKTEFEKFVADAAVIGFKVSIKMAKQQYAAGQVHIAPTHKDVVNGYKWTWTPEQFDAVRNFLKSQNMYVAIVNLFSENAYYCFKQGVHYMTRIKGQSQ